MGGASALGRRARSLSAAVAPGDRPLRCPHCPCRQRARRRIGDHRRAPKSRPRSVQRRWSSTCWRPRAGPATAPAAVPESLLKPAIAAGDWRIATEAAFRLTTIRAQAGRITAETARHELEAQRLLWRGHPDEVTMLRHLVVLELRAGQPAKGAEWLGMLLDRGPSKRGASSGEDPSSMLFLALARAGRSDAAIAISALAIYRRHPELLSAAERGEALHNPLSASRRLASTTRQGSSPRTELSLPSRDDDPDPRLPSARG